jgi:hypothetical protein
LENLPIFIFSYKLDEQVDELNHACWPCLLRKYSLVVVGNFNGQ